MKGIPKHLSGEMSQLRVQLRGLELPPSQLTPSAGNSIPSRGNLLAKAPEAGKVLVGGRSQQGEARRLAKDRDQAEGPPPEGLKSFSHVYLAFILEARGWGDWRV